MANQNKIFSFKIKRDQKKNVIPSDVERTVTWLNHGAEQKHKSGFNRLMKDLGHRIYDPTHHRASKEESIAINQD